MIRDAVHLDDLLSEPPGYVVDSFRGQNGDLLILGAAGKMGPTLSRMARRAMDEAGAPGQVIAVSRFSNPSERAKLESWNIRTLAGDLLDEDFVQALPDAPRVVYMAGMKFGASGNEPLTWASNTYLPALVCRRYPQSRIAAFSTGNVYGLVPIKKGGSVETDALNPTGEYAMSCHGRERMFEYFSAKRGTPVAIIRLNYACELRYGVLVDLARQVWEGQEGQGGQSIDVTMSAFNVIWQGDANAMTLAALMLAGSPAVPLNISGPELLRVREVCERFAAIMKKDVRFTSTEASDAHLNDASKSHRLFGRPRVSANQLMQWIADWIMRGGGTLNKPTHFQTRDGRF